MPHSVPLQRCYRASGYEIASGELLTERWYASALFVRLCSEQAPALIPLDPGAFAPQFAQRCDRAGIRTRRCGCLSSGAEMEYVVIFSVLVMFVAFGRRYCGIKLRREIARDAPDNLRTYSLSHRTWLSRDFTLANDRGETVLAVTAPSAWGDTYHFSVEGRRWIARSILTAPRKSWVGIAAQHSLGMDLEREDGVPVIKIRITASKATFECAGRRYVLARRWLRGMAVLYCESTMGAVGAIKDGLTVAADLPWDLPIEVVALVMIVARDLMSSE